MNVRINIFPFVHLRKEYFKNRKEVIQDQLPLALPCYDLVPVTEPTVSPRKYGSSGIPSSLDLTGNCLLGFQN